MLKQYLQFKLSQKLSPQQIQLMKLIQLPTQAFEQRIKARTGRKSCFESGKEEMQMNMMMILTILKTILMIMKLLILKILMLMNI